MAKRNCFRLLLVLAGVCLICSGCDTPVNKQTFQYPAGPVEGPAGYFVITENGEAKCCLVKAAAPKPEEAGQPRCSRPIFSS